MNAVNKILFGLTLVIMVVGFFAFTILENFPPHQASFILSHVSTDSTYTEVPHNLPASLHLGEYQTPTGPVELIANFTHQSTNVISVSTVVSHYSQEVNEPTVDLMAFAAPRIVSLFQSTGMQIQSVEVIGNVVLISHTTTSSLASLD